MLSIAFKINQKMIFLHYENLTKKIFVFFTKSKVQKGLLYTYIFMHFNLFKDKCIFWLRKIKKNIVCLNINKKVP